MKSIVEYIIESIDGYALALSQLGSGKMNDTKLINKISSDINAFKNTSVKIDLGEIGYMTASFSNYDYKGKTCKVEYNCHVAEDAMKSKRQDELTLPIRDAFQKVINIAKSFKK